MLGTPATGVAKNLEPRFRFALAQAHRSRVTSPLVNKPIVAKLFASQHGLATRQQLLELGVTARMISRRLTSGEWIVVHQGVYRLAGAPVSHEQALMAAVLFAGPGAAVSDRAAAILHGTWAFRADDLIEITSPRRVSLPGAVVHRGRVYDEAHIVRMRGLPVTSAARTIVDIGAVASLQTVNKLVEEWLADRKVSVADLRSTIDDVHRRGSRSAGVARRVLEARSLGDEAGDSTDEHLIATIMRAYGAPPPAYHALVDVGLSRPLELDHAYVPEKIDLEVHGQHLYTGNKRKYAWSLERTNLLQAHGWLVLQYTPAQLKARPWAIAREIDGLRIARRPAVAA
jgi:hypothetical protein